MTTNSELLDISEILYDNYYTLGVTGSQAMLNIQEDIGAGLFEETVDGWGITYDELSLAIDSMRRRLILENAMTVERGIGAPLERVAGLIQRSKLQTWRSGRRVKKNK